MKTFTRSPLRGLVTTCLMLLATLSASAYDFESDGIYYSIIDDVSVAVTYETTSYNSYSGDVVIPSTVTNDGTTYTVTSVWDWAFYGCTDLTGVTLPESLTAINSFAFYHCSSLPSISFPESVTYIGEAAFNGCSSLTSVNLPDGVTVLTEGLFYECSSLASVTLPESLTSIGNSVFAGCSSLTGVTLPATVTSLGHYAFYNCTGLTSITLPESVTSLGESAFSGCTGLEAVYVSDLESWCNIAIKNFQANPLYYAQGLYVNGELLTDIVVPEGVTSIGDYAFNYYTSLTSITLPEGVTSIGNSAFDSCTGLTSVNIPEGTSSIGKYAFRKCTSLADVTVGGGLTSIGEYAFNYCSSMTNFTFPEGLTSIGGNAFMGCSSLTSVTLPEGVTSIGEHAFSDCTGLTSVTLSDGLTSIGESVFSYCTSLTGIVIPEGVTSIGDWAFYNCHSLKSINFPGDLVSIASYALEDCGQLSDIYCYCVTPPSLLSGVRSSGTLHVLNGLATKYNGFVSGWTIVEDLSTFTMGGISYNIISGDDMTVEVARVNTSVSGEVTIPGTVTSDSPTYTVTAIADSAFLNCTGVTSLTIGESVTSIGQSAFSGCTSLTDIYCYYMAPLTIQSDSFKGASSSGTLHVLKGLADKYNAFAEGWTVVDDLSTFTMDGISYNIISADDMTVEVAHLDTNVSSVVTIPGTVTSDGLTYTVTAIADGAFLNCTGVISITIGENVTSIGQNAFSGCTGLAYVICSSTTPPTLSSTAFDTSTYSGAILYVPKGSADAYKAADYWSNFTNIVENNPEGGISTPVELLAIADDLSGDYTLAADIDMSGITFTPMGEFTGTLDGRGHVIKNLTYDNAKTDNVGLFSTARGATVKNLGIQGARIVGNANAGGFIGRMYGGTISNCFLLDSYVEGSDHVGSILGYLDNNDGALSTMSDCASDSRIKTRSYQVGGMAGVMHGGTLERCLFTGTVESSGTNATGLVSLIDADTYTNVIQNNMLASAHVYGNSNSSYLIVYTASRSVTLSNNYVLSSTFTNKSGNTVGTDNGSANAYTGGRADDATARSKDFYANTLGWDFDSTWTFAGGTEGCMYPMLQVMPTPLATRIYDVPTDTVLYADRSETLNLNLGHGSWGQELSYEITGGADLATLSDGVLTPNSDAAGSGYVTVVASFPEAASAVLDPGSIEIKVLVGTTTGIGEVDSAADTAPAEPAYYSLDGRRLSAPRKGVNIVRLPDGTVKKVLVK